MNNTEINLCGISSETFMTVDEIYDMYTWSQKSSIYKKTAVFGYYAGLDHIYIYTLRKKNKIIHVYERLSCIFVHVYLYMYETPGKITPIL